MSSAYRVTQRTVATTMMTGLQSNMSRIQRLQERLSSGKDISRPSDSPVRTVEAMQLRSGIRRAEQYVRNSDSGLALLGMTDTVLTKSLDLTGRARELLLQGMTDSLGAESRVAIAAEIDTLRQGLIGAANTVHGERPLFGGNAQGATAYAEDGSYLGDAGKVERTVAPDTRVKVNVTGEEVFGVGDAQLFKVLEDLAAALREPQNGTRKAALDSGLGRLDRAIDKVITSLGEVGARYNRLETAKSTAEGQLLTMANGLSEAEDIDLPKTIIDLQMQEVAYKAALGAAARVVQPSLLDFLR